MELIRKELSKKVLESLKKKRNQSMIGSVMSKSNRASGMKIDDVDEAKLIE